MCLPDTDWLPGAICIAQPTGTAWPPLAPDEALLVAQSLPRRREHFATGRACAHEALRQLGHPVPALLRRESGGPDWPAGFVGSIAHCEGMAGAIVAADTRWQGLGIDVEPDRALPDDVAGYALTDAERARLAQSPDGIAQAGLVAFSAKECVHKCLHPLRGAFLGFDEVEIDFTAAGFSPRPLSAAAIMAFDGLRFEGRWRRSAGFVWALLGVA